MEEKKFKLVNIVPYSPSFYTLLRCVLTERVHRFYFDRYTIHKDGLTEFFYGKSQFYRKHGYFIERKIAHFLYYNFLRRLSTLTVQFGKAFEARKLQLPSAANTKYNKWLRYQYDWRTNLNLIKSHYKLKQLTFAQKLFYLFIPKREYSRNERCYFHYYQIVEIKNDDKQTGAAIRGANVQS